MAVGAFVRRPDGRLLWLRRAKEPGRGKLGLAGGFLDLWETAEEALVRELREETGLEPLSWRFVCSAPNPYEFAGVRYPVCDLFFEVRVAAEAAIRAQASEVAGWEWLPEEAVNPDDIAFPSVRHAFAILRGRSPTDRET